MQPVRREGFPGVFMDYCYAVPNGIFIPGSPQLSARIMARMKREGLKPGVSDLVCILPTSDGEPGFYLELKRDKNSRPSVDQLNWHLLARRCGYRTAVAVGLDEAMGEFGKAYRAPLY